MIYLIIITMPLVTGILEFASAEVLSATETILEERGIGISECNENRLITKSVELDIKSINDYTIEDQPDDDPGWTLARYHLVIELQEIEKGATDVSIKANFERFGVRSAILLIPPVWTPVPSNGVLEKEIMKEIEDRFSAQLQEEQ